MANGEVTATSLNNAAYAFSIADLNSDGFLLPTEYDLYRIHTVDRVGVTSCHGGKGEAPVIKRDIDAPVVDDCEEADRLFRISARSGDGVSSRSPARGRPGESGMPEQSPVRCGLHGHFSVNGHKD